MLRRAGFLKLLGGGVLGAVVLAMAYGLCGWWVREGAAETLQRAENRLRRGDNAAARETLRWLLWFEPAHPRALLIAGVSLNADRRFSEAVSVLERIPEEITDYEQAGIALAASLIADGRFERAEDLLQQLWRRYPASRDIRDRLARLYLKQLRQRDALELMLEHRRRFPDDLSVLPDLLELEAKTVTPHDRLADLEAADRKHPRQAPLVLALARAYWLMGKTDSARGRFQSALQLRPHDLATRILAAQFHLDCGEWETARSLLDPPSESPTTDAPHDDRYWFVRSRLAEQSGDAPQAYACLEQALALRPHEEAYLLMQAGLLRRLGRTDAAASALGRAARLAEARKQLLLLADRLDRNQPQPELCLQIAGWFDQLGHSELAADWRHLARAAPMNDPARLPASASPLPHAVGPRR